MPRGELVGDAYIRITADTTAMRRALKREAALAEAEGGQAGKGYTSAFGKEVEAHADDELKGARAKIRAALKDALTTGDFDQFENAMGDIDGAVRKVREELNKLRDSGELNSKEFEVFTKQVDKWAKFRGVEEKSKSEAAALEKVRAATRKARDEFERLDRDHARAIKENDKREAAAALKRLAALQAEAKDLNRLRDLVNRDHIRALKEDQKRTDAQAALLKKLRDSVEKAHGQALKEDAKRTAKIFNDAFDEARRMNKAFDASTFDEKLRDAALAAARFNDNLRKTGQIKIGESFDEARVSLAKLRQGLTGVDALEFKRVRNLAGDIRNAGREANRIENLFAGMDKSLQGLSRRGGPLVDLFTAPLRAAASFGALVEKLFPSGGGGFSGGLTTFIGSIAAAGAAIGVLLVSLSLLFSALSLVAGMLVIATVGLGTALAGAALTAAAAIPAVTLAIGGLIIAFKGFNDAYPEVVGKLKKFGSEAAGALRQSAFRDIGKQVDAFIDALTPLAGPLMKGIGDALHDTFQGFVDLMKSRPMRTALDVFVKELPKQVALLGDAFVRTFGGLVSFFSVLQPFATRFLTAIDDLAKTFQTWAASTEGKNTIAAFMERAFTAASTLWDILKNVATAIGGIFSAGAGDGQGFLQWLSDITKKFSDFVNSAEGQNTIREWLGEARTAAEKLGAAIGAISVFFDQLDTTKGREQVTGLLSGVDKVISAMNTMDGLFTKVENFLGAFEKVGKALDDVGGKDPGKAAEGLKDIADTLNVAVPAQGNIVDSLTGFVDDMDKADWNGVVVGLDGITAAAEDADTSMSGWDIFGSIGESISGFLFDLDTQFFEGLDQIISGVGGFFSDIGNMFVEGFGQIVSGVGEFSSDIGHMFLEGLGQIISGVGGFFSDIGTMFMEGLGQIGQFFAELPTTLSYLGGALVGIITTQIVDAWNAASMALTEQIIPFFTALPGQIGDAIISAGNWIQGWFQAGYDNIIAFFEETIIPFFVSVPGRIADAIVSAGNWIQGWFQAGYDNIIAFFETTIIPFFVSVPGRISDAIIAAGDWIQVWFQRGYDNIVAFFQNTIIPWFAGIPGWFTETLLGGGGDSNNSLLDWFKNMWAGLTNWWTETAWPWLRGLPAQALIAFTGIAVTIGKGIADYLRDVVNGLIDQINAFISGFNNFSPFDIPTLRHLASGGLVDRPTMAMVGEAGREMVVPLDRPLSQVDESVRWLAAIAQGKTSYASGGVAGGRSVNIAPGAIAVTAMNADPEQVASAVLDRVAIGAWA